MNGFEIPEINNEVKISQEEWNKFQEDLRIAKFKLQEINDNLEGGLTSRNLASFRNTYVINAQDSLDATYPMYVHFNIISEMVKIVSVKVSFWILNYRAYSTAAASGGAVSSASGGGETPTSSGFGAMTGYFAHYDENLFWKAGLKEGETDFMILTLASYNLLVGHTHTVTIAAHTHTGGAHTHNITYGIHEEANSPTIKFYVSENAGISYSDVFGGYDADKSGIDITSWLTRVGSKLIKFTSDVRARLSVQIEIKLDIKSR